jgi:hypothetical protein
LSPFGSWWSAILYRPPYGLTGCANRQTGHEVVLRTVTLHLPTNIPPPLHSEIISIDAFQLVRIGIARPWVSTKLFPFTKVRNDSAIRLQILLLVEEQASEQDQAQTCKQPEILFSIGVRHL